MLKKNTAVTGFPIGHFINATTGETVTTGTPTCKRLLDGTGAAMANAASYNTDGGQWEIDLAQADTNGDVVGFSFTLTDCLPISTPFFTTTKLVSELQDLTAAQVNAEVDTAISDAALATAANLATVDTVVDGIKAKTDALPASPAAVGSNMGTVSSVTNPVTVGTNSDKTGYSISGTKTTLDALNDITAASVWAHGTRTLSSFGTLVADIWAHAARTLTGFGTLASDVWAVATRTITGAVDLNADQAVNVTKVGGTAVAGPNDLKADVSGLSTFDPLTDEVTVVAASITAIAVETTSDVEGGILGLVKVSTDRLEGLVEDSTGDRFTAKALEAAPSGGSAPTVGEIADAVWDEALAGHATAGSAGAGLTAAGNAGDPWAATLPGAYTGNQAGKRLADIQAKTALITTGGVNVQSPVTSAGNLIILKGDTYEDSETREIIIEPADPSDWPDLATATIKLFVDIKSQILEFSAAHSSGSVVVELTATQTASIPAGQYSFALRATMANSNIVTLTRGTLVSTRVP